MLRVIVFNLTGWLINIMLVKDKLADNKYKMSNTEAAEKACPCRSCYNAHDCGYRTSSGKWVVSMRCATRNHNGCPEIYETKHVYKRNRGKKCLRCGELK